MFTKLLKPVYASLRKKGHESSRYIDYSYLQGDDYADYVANLKCALSIFHWLGFIPQPEKSKVDIPWVHIRLS